MGNLGYGFCPTHPGEIVKDELEARGLSQREIAAKVGVSYTTFNDILNAHRPLTAATALLLEAALGIEADTLMRLQFKYNMQTARQNRATLNKVKEIRKIAAVF
jgi:addiction module HigA family antidote